MCDIVSMFDQQICFLILMYLHYVYKMTFYIEIHLSLSLNP